MEWFLKNYYTCVTVFRTYRREGVPTTTNHLPIGLALSFVVVDNRTWPSVPLGPHPGYDWFSPQNAHTHHQVSLVVTSYPPCAISCLNFCIKADPHLDPCLFLGRRRSRGNILKTSMTPFDYTACRLVSFVSTFVAKVIAFVLFIAVFGSLSD